MYRRTRTAKRFRKRKKYNLVEESVVNHSNSIDLFSFLNECPKPLISSHFVTNVINTSLTKIREYKRQKLINSYNNNYYSIISDEINGYKLNDFYIDDLDEPFNTVFVSGFGRPKPNRKHIYDYFTSFGPISQLITNCNSNECSNAFIEFKSSTDAYNLCHSLDKIKFCYKGLKDMDILVFPRLHLCNNEGIESIANFTPIDRKLIIEKLLRAQHFEQQFDVLRNELIITEDDCNQRIELMAKLESILNENYLNCKLHIFGSTLNKLGFRDTDIDVFIEIFDENNFFVKMCFSKAIKLLRIIHRILIKRLNMFIPQPIESKRCPILRLDFKHFGDSLRSTGITCDLSLTNSLGIRNSKLISFFCELEPRFQKLSIALRYLAKLNGFIGTSQMSSYAFSMLIVFFCQRLNPPLLPTVDHLMALCASNQSLIINGLETTFCTDIEVYRMSVSHEENQMSAIHLLKLFFQYYADFDFTNRVICPRIAKSIHKSNYENMLRNNKSQNMTNDLPFKMNPFLCIEDPFDSNFNLTGHTQYHFFSRFIQYFKVINNNNYLYFNENIQENGFIGFSKLFEVQNNLNNDYEDKEDCDVIQIEQDFGYSVSSSAGLIDPIIGKVKVNFSSTHTNRDLEQKLIEMTNTFTDFVKKLLSFGYKFDCSLINRSHIKLGQKSSFAQFVCKFRSYDEWVTDSWNREPVISDLEQQLSNYGFIEREEAISERIIKVKTNETKSMPTHVSFEFVLDTTSSTYNVYFNIIEIKPNPKYGNHFIYFIMKGISSGVESENILAVDDDLFLI